MSPLPAVARAALCLALAGAALAAAHFCLRALVPSTDAAHPAPATLLTVAAILLTSAIVRPTLQRSRRGASEDLS